MNDPLPGSTPVTDAPCPPTSWRTDTPCPPYPRSPTDTPTPNLSSLTTDKPGQSMPRRTKEAVIRHEGYFNRRKL